MKIAAIENPRSRQEELGQFLTAMPVADFMASMFGPSRSDGCATPRDRCGLLVKAIIELFCARWAPSAAILGIRDTKRDVVHLNSKALAAVDVTLDSSTKPPGVIIHHKARNRLLLIEPVIETGPVDENRHKELQELVAGSDAQIIFVTPFETRRTMQTFASEIAWDPKSGSPKTPTT